jgi:putative ABC transport system permease protein
VLQPLVTNSNVFSIEGRPAPPPGQQVEYPVENVSPGYFETLGVRLHSGRTFTAQDHANAPAVVIINETFARQGWPGQDPLGRRIRAGSGNSQSPWLTVVGVVRDLRRADLRRDIRPELYVCTLQRMPRSQMLLVRTAGDPSAIVSAVRREVQALNPQLPLFAVGTLQGELAETLSPARFGAVLLATFAVVAVLLASVGIYGVTAHAIGQRTHEVGIRMALGARRADVLGMMLGQHLRPALAGLVIGAAGALILSRSLSTLVYGVGVTDPVTDLAMAGLLLTVTLAACMVPSLRATRVDPLIALKGE